VYEKILVPIDGSATAARGLTEAIALAKAMGARLRLMHIMEMSAATASAAVHSPELVEQLKSEAEDILERAKWMAQSAALELDTMLGDGFGDRRLHDFVAEQVTGWGAQLIVLGTHGRRGMRRLVLGSDAEAIVRAATVPVLLVRAE
jgi:nucleotide-binding universal stress UspA family protein